MRLFFFILVCFVIFFTLTASAQNVCEEGERRWCGTDIGVCEPGVSICRDGEWIQCEGLVGPASEADICGNGIDDNCNGKIDEDCFPWFSLILVGFGILFIGIGLYYMQKEKGERIITEGVAKD